MNSDSSLVPCLPDNAPFTPEQRAYLNGFFAGLFSRTPASSAAAPPPPEQALQPLTILFGSQTGNAEGLAKRVAKEAGKQGFAATVFDMAQYPRENLPREQHLLITTSTYGDGDPPDNARGLVEFLCSDQAPALSDVKFSVLALGDTNYEKFCECGKTFDNRLEALGARRVYPRTDCDVDFEEPFQTWLNGVLPSLKSVISDQSSVISCAPDASATDHGLPAEASSNPDARMRSEAKAGPRTTGHDKRNPFSAPLLANRKLNGGGSDKDTRHFEIALAGSGLSYEVGDALGVVPANCPGLVEELLNALGHSGDEAVTGVAGRQVSMRDALARHYEITKIPQPLLCAVAERTSDEHLQKLIAPGVNGELTKFLWGREIIDLLLAHPGAKFTATEFVSLLKKLPPRLYSISSSPKAHEGQVHLTVAVVRYSSLGRDRKGVCSTFLAERVPAGAWVPVFVHKNKGFRPPADGSRPMIMIGPGTGIAPFRAFLEERRETGAQGRNWLFFGDQHAATDFLYRNELEAMLRSGPLTRLDTAFSRDQEQKVYVQHRMIDHAKEVYAWLEEGAHFYVCGDASRMAKDVDKALHEVVQLAGGKTPEDAAAYIRKLQAEKRYQRDVY
ncbi:MAG TPA: sulfite reductase subunit alpha [Verrucomicrobiae bacterium]|nr:sulfite reductase subunit alpha [Verrucomicrobiae bacterium]